MISMTWRWALLATGAVLAASSLAVAGCSKGDSGTADAGGGDPSAATRAIDSADAGGPSPGATTGPGSIESSAILSGAGTPTAASPYIGSETGATPSPSASAAGSDPSSSSPGRATGPR